ncbi:MAG: DUF4870 domain-containing protein [Anaerolineales bacterium]|nr:DUF4870 domain-containing protein [Anaerolineales bacterium]MCA9932042.1 DUF4870 domain-containing protein [Anaerolineales bacterium]
MTEEFDNFDDEMKNDIEESLPVEELSDSFNNSDVTEDDKLWAFLAYVFTPLIPIILLLIEDKKDRPFIKAHNAQALAWGIFNLIGGTILSSILFFCFGLPSILIWGVGVYWGWKAYQGEYVTIPVVTDFVKGQGWA